MELLALITMSIFAAVLLWGTFAFGYWCANRKWMRLVKDIFDYDSNNKGTDQTNTR